MFTVLVLTAAVIEFRRKMNAITELFLSYLLSKQAYCSAPARGDFDFRFSIFD